MMCYLLSVMLLCVETPDLREMNVNKIIDKKDILYSGKVSLVQNFAELPPRPSEEIFEVLKFVPVLQRDHTHHLLITLELIRKALH